MSNMYDRIVRRCSEIGVTPGKMCDDLKMRRAGMSELKTRRTGNFAAERVAQIAAYLRCSCDYLITGDEFRPEYSAKERELVSAWRLATDDERENVAFVLRKYMTAPDLPSSEEADTRAG